MRRVIIEKQDIPEIPLNDLVHKLIEGKSLTVVYLAKSEQPYYAFLDSTSHGEYGFRSHTNLHSKMTYRSTTIKETLLLAIKGKKEILVFERHEMDKLFKF